MECNSQKSNSGRDNTDTLGTTDTIIKDIPSNIQSQEWYKLFFKEKAMLNLNSIENGYNDLQIRMWIRHGYGESQKNSSQLIIIKKTINDINGELHTYLPKYGPGWDSIFSIDRKLDTLIPKSGWESFINKIGELGIYDLPHYKALSGYFLDNDSDGVIVEIATSRKYRIYYYPDYIQHKDQFKEAGKMYKTMRLAEQEFNIKVNY